MKRGVLLLMLLALFAWLSGEQLLHKTLDNGLEVVIKENFVNNSVSVNCFLRTGSIHEEEYLGMGISHVLEHIVSGGASRFHSEEEYIEMQRSAGIESNAYTSFGMVNYYLNTDTEHATLAVKTLMEQVYYSKLDKGQFRREMKVIEKEVVMGETSPEAKIAQRCMQLFYPGTPYRYPIIGLTSHLRSITHEMVKDYYHRRHSPENMLLVICGSFDANEIMQTVEKTWGTITPRGRDAFPTKQPHVVCGQTEIIEEFDIRQPQINTFTPLPREALLDSYAIGAAMGIFADHRYSPLVHRLKEEEQLCSQVWMWYNEDKGIDFPSLKMTVYADSTKNLPRILEIVDEELARFCEKGITSEELKKEVGPRIDQTYFWEVTAGQEAQITGGRMITGALIPDIFGIQARAFESLTVDEVNRAIRRYLSLKNRTVFMAVPTGEAQLLKKDSDKAVTREDINRTRVDDRITLLHRLNSAKPIVRGIVYLPLSSDHETPDMAGMLNYMTGLIVRGAEDDDPLALERWTEEHNVRFDAWTEDRGTKLCFQCLKEDIDEVLTRLIRCLDNPGFKQSEVDRARHSLIFEQNRNQIDDGFLHEEYRRGILYKNMRDGLQEELINLGLVELDTDSLKTLYRQYFKSDSLIVTVFGDLTRDEATAIAKRLAEHIPPGNPGPRIVDNARLDQVTYEQTYPYEPVNITVCYPGQRFEDPDYNALRVIDILCNSAHGRMFEAIRGGDNNLAYWGYAYQSNGVFSLRSQTTFDKKDDLLKALLGITRDLREKDITPEELTTAIESYRKSSTAYMNDNELMFVLTDAQAERGDWRYFYDEYDLLRKVTPAQVKAAANRYLANPTIFISEPDETVKKMVDTP